MGKYSALQTDIFSVFNSVAWNAELIRTVPVNYNGESVGNEYIRVVIIPEHKGLNLKSASGILSIDIFTPAGDGPNRTSFIADKLDDYLVGKSLSTVSGVTQFDRSNLQPFGVDKANPTLYRSIYSITFNYFGV
jgi:hypothetical protein